MMLLTMTYGFYYFFGFKGPPLRLEFCFRRPWVESNAHGLFSWHTDAEKHKNPKSSKPKLREEK